MYILCEVKSFIALPCVTFELCTCSRPFPVPRQVRASKPEKTLNSCIKITNALRRFFGHIATALVRGAMPSRNVCGRSSENCPSNPPIPSLPYPAILDRIRRCGRLGAEHEARRLYLAHGIGFRQYRSAYEMGRQEARQMQPMLSFEQEAGHE